MSGLATPLCDEIGIRLPIWSVGFGMGAGPELVAAVSNAGGLGVLGTYDFAPETITAQIARTRELTSRPFGVNFIIADDGTPEDRQTVVDAVDAASAAQVPVIVLFWGDPGPYLPAAHANGVRVVVQVGSVAEALLVASAGVAGVIVQGVEAGGHVRGTTSVWDLLPRATEGVAPIPVLASGGIGDGEGIARALRLGAQGVSLGTRFVASDEARVHPEHKRRIVAASANDTVLGDLYDEWWPAGIAAARTLRNQTLDEWEAAGRPARGQRPGEGTSIGSRRLPDGGFQPWPRYAVGLLPPEFEGDLDRAPMLTGESCEVIHDVKPAAEIVRTLAREAEAALASTAG